MSTSETNRGYYNKKSFGKKLQPTSVLNSFNRHGSNSSTTSLISSGVSSIHSSPSAQFFMQKERNKNQLKFPKADTNQPDGSRLVSSKVSQLVNMHSSNMNGGTGAGRSSSKVRRWGADKHNAGSNSGIGPSNVSSLTPFTAASSPYSKFAAPSSSMSDPGSSFGQFKPSGINTSNQTTRRSKPFPGNSPLNKTSTPSSFAVSPRRKTPGTGTLTPMKPNTSYSNSNTNLNHNDKTLASVSSQKVKKWGSSSKSGESSLETKLEAMKSESLNGGKLPPKKTDFGGGHKAASFTKASHSGDSVHVWVRHSILSHILSPKPTYGANATPGKKVGKNNSFSSDVNSSLNTSSNHSFATPTKSLRSRSAPNMDDVSTTSNNTDSKSVGTTSARWGWVKASLLNYDAFSENPNKNSKHDQQNAIEEAKSSPNPWQSQLKSKNGVSAEAQIQSEPTPPVEHKQKEKPKVVIVKVIDLESDYNGSTVELPVSSLFGSNHNSDFSDDNSVNAGNIFGDGIVMANQWPNFTSIPKPSSSNATAPQTKDNNSSKWGTHGVFSSSSAKYGRKEPESKIDEVDDNAAIPQDLTNLTHLHEPAVVYCLRSRYAMDEIYTSTGPILLALNPFKDLRGIYSDDLMRKYCERGQGMFGSSVSVKKKRNSTASTDDLSPHVYAVADNAYRSMMRQIEDNNGDEEAINTDQSILVSGESGAGKTVTTKIIMKYLASLSKRSSSKNDSSSTSCKNRKAKSFHFSPQSYVHGVPDQSQSEPITPNGMISTNIEQQVLESNPILESFGNARTIRNDNSSRFGKFIEIQFSRMGKLLGASVESYLLEKVRLIKQSDGERNYHVFYELLSGASGSERKELLLGRANPEDFAMTLSPSGTYKRRDGVRDDTTFAAMRKALVTMGFSAADQMDILRIVSALLHLSNLSFLEDSSGGCTLDDKNPSLPSALQLLGVTKDNLDEALCCVNIEAGGEKVVKKLFLEQAMKAKEAMIKATYGALFEYLVLRINKCINGERKGRDENTQTNNVELEVGFLHHAEPCAAFIGVLDIFGFESFQQNSFEQLCINYCNESLQQQFNKFVFKLEQAEYEKEGIQWNFIAFPDNQDVLDLIQKKRAGIFSICDEQSFLTQCTDQSFIQSVYQKCGSGRGGPFVASTRQMARACFSINHYAGPVEYDSSGFLEKNKDELPKEIDELLQSSKNEFLQHLGTVINSTEENVSESKSSRSSFKQSSLKRITVGGQFSSQLQELRTRIDNTSPHYIRCLKPNNALEPNNFDSAVIADQLRCAGILEAVRVSRVGYPQRYLHKTFVQRYQVLAMKELQIRRMDVNSNFKSPAVGFGFHGFVPTKREKPSPTVNVKIHTQPTNEKKLNAEQECKILINALAKLIITTQKSGESDEEVENIAPSSIRWTSPGQQPKKWPTPGSQTKAYVPIRPMKQDIDLVQIGIQMGKTKVFLRQHAFEFLERMRGRIKSSAATVINSVLRMFLCRKRYIIMRNEYRARVAQRSRIIREGGFGTEAGNEINTDFVQSNEYYDDGPHIDFRQMRISIHREEDYGTKEFKWVMIDNRWVKNDSDDE